MNKNFRIGILGGMGPLAGVHLQRLIIDNTPAKKDQDHIQVVCFTNPKIVDRTVSIKEDTTEELVTGIIDSLDEMNKISPDIAVIACNTAHSQLPKIQEETQIPLLNMIEVTADEIVDIYGKNAKVGLLATDGTLNSGIYQNNTKLKEVRWVLPGGNIQSAIMNVIYGIKAGKKPNGFKEEIALIINFFKYNQVHVIILGCTELSLCDKHFAHKEFETLDPLQIAAKRLVNLATKKKK